MPEGRFRLGQGTPFRIVPVVVDPGHDLNAGRGADRLRIAVGEADPFLGHAIEVGRVVGYAAIDPEAFEAHVIGHDEDDVRLVLSLSKRFFFGPTGKRNRAHDKSRETTC